MFQQLPIFHPHRIAQVKPITFELGLNRLNTEAASQLWERTFIDRQMPPVNVLKPALGPVLAVDEVFIILGGKQVAFQAKDCPITFPTHHKIHKWPVILSSLIIKARIPDIVHAQEQIAPCVSVQGPQKDAVFRRGLAPDFDANFDASTR